MTNNKDEQQMDSFWKMCGQAVDMTIEEGSTLGGYTIERIFKNLNKITSANEWDKEYLFRRAAIPFIETYLNSIDYRCGKRKSGVFFHEKIRNSVMREGFAFQEQQLADSYQAKADELYESVKIVGDHGIDHQMNLFNEEERTISAWIEEIKKLEG